jgi:putative nucleotidyltransferase with HDIG domain
VIDLEAVMRSANDLEPLPASATRLAELVSREDSHLQEIEEVIRFDQALTGRLLRSANSAANATSREITTVREAVMRLGAGTVLSLAIGFSVRKHLDAGDPEHGLAEGALWRHSVATALAAQMAAPFLQVSVPAESFTAALLHDLGKLILCRFLTPQIRMTLYRAYSQGAMNRLQAERSVLGIDHGELGGIVARHWGLPDSIVNGIIYHHNPQKADEKVCYITSLADMVALTIGTAVDADLPVPEGHQEIRLRLGITARGFQQLCVAVADKLADLSERYAA